MITDDDRQFLKSFEQCSLGAKCWNHAAHVRICWTVLETSKTFEEALTRLRAGIMQFNSSRNSIGYHETITVAFARIIAAKRDSTSTWKDFTEKHVELFDKKMLKDFYSEDILKSEASKQTFVQPDKKPLPSATV